MADENVIIIEEEGEKKEKKSKKLFFIVVILVLIVIILLLILTAVVVIKKKKSRQEVNSAGNEIEKITKKLEKKHLAQKDEIKELIKRATILYNRGEKEKALQILNKLSSLSEALSYYNLGVIKLEEKNYPAALKYFQKAIENKDNRTLSAINATYAALMLKDYKLFNYYRNLAYTFLPEISKLKSYPYYYAVVMYYKGYEFDAIAALKQKTPYETQSKKLLSAIYEYNGDFLDAAANEEDYFYKGLSLARVGEYSIARSYLSAVNSPKAKFALGLVNLKLQSYKSAAGAFNKSNQNFYPIYVYLKPSLFDIKSAQKEFKKNFLKHKEDFYDLFFYYAPYKVFNINQTISYLKKGIAGIPIGSIEESQKYLTKSATYSSLNLQIADALKLALNGHIYLANKKFKKLVKKRHTSYIINYDLALTYAQLGDYEKAYNYFLRAYHLNPQDLKSGIFAIMALQKIKKQNDYLITSVKEDLQPNTIEDAMFSLTQDNTVKLAAYLEKDNKNDVLNLITRISAKALLNRDYSSEALQLKSMFPREIIANLLYFYAQNKDLPVNKLALNFQSLYFSNHFDMNDFYYGAKIVREWYFTFTKISGLLNDLREKLIQKAKAESFDLIPILKRVAFADFYTKHFEEGYVIYNDLINNKHINDPHMLYFAGVCAIGASHHANAVALMELAKMRNPNFYEARYALGLLWQERGNIKGAAIQYAKIPTGFNSKFFDFNINNRLTDN